MYIDVNSQGLLVFGKMIPFWMICVLLLVYIIYLKHGKINRFFNTIFSNIKRFFVWLWSKAKDFWSWIKSREFWESIRSYFRMENTEEGRADHSSKQFYVILIFLISMMLFFTYLIVPDVYNRNVPELIKPAFLITALIVFLVVWFIFILMSSIGLYIKDISLWIWILGSFAVMYKLNNLLGKTIGIIVLIIVLVLYPYLMKDSKQPRNWLWLTMLVMIVSLFSGIALIDTTYGNHHPVEMSLNINGDIYNKYASGHGQINCITNNKIIETIIGDNLTCSIKPPFNIAQANLSITYGENITKVIDLVNTSYTFQAEKNISYLYFEISGQTKKGKPLFISTGGNPNFESYPSLDKTESKRKEFIKYLGILFTAVFVTIPIMMYHLRGLSKRKTGEEF